MITVFCCFMIRPKVVPDSGVPQNVLIESDRPRRYDEQKLEEGEDGQ